MAAVASSRWMLHIGGGWGDSPLLCKALYKCNKLLFIKIFVQEAAADTERNLSTHLFASLHPSHSCHLELFHPSTFFTTSKNQKTEIIQMICYKEKKNSKETEKDRMTNRDGKRQMVSQEEQWGMMKGSEDRRREWERCRRAGLERKEKEDGKKSR